MNRVAILVVVAAALGGVLWMKSQATSEDPPTAQAEPAVGASTSVLLFADPREAEARCGCAEVIRLARGTGGVPGVVFREFDTREGTPEAKQYRVRVSPTVIITDAAGAEEARFEGESGDVIARLQGAVSSLRDKPGTEESADR